MTVHKAARLAAARARIMAAYRAGCIRTAVVADRSQSGRSPRSGQQGVNDGPNKGRNNENMTTLLATVTASQDAGGTLVAGSTIYAVLCVLEFLIAMAFAVLWFAFPLIIWTKLNDVIKLLNAITKAGERNTP
jgi:hypothetical protein